MSIPWASIADGIVLFVGGIVTHGGASWQCLEAHRKSTEHEPGDDCEAWVRIPINRASNFRRGDKSK